MDSDKDALPAPVFAGPVKHSVSIAGHQTSISLEPIFWMALQRAAAEESISVNALVARIDQARISFAAQNRSTVPSTAAANLASAVRSWLWERYCE